MKSLMSWCSFRTELEGKADYTCFNGNSGKGYSLRPVVITFDNEKGCINTPYW